MDRLTVELLVQDGADRAVGAGPDLQRPQTRRLHPGGAEGLHQAHDPQAGAEALFGMWPIL